MKTYLFSIFIAITLLSSCTKQQDLQQKNIDIEGAMEKLTPIKVSEISQQLDFIPLETTEESLIGNNPKIKVLPNIILVESSKQPLKAFDSKTGKYLYNIGHIGNDPEGYMANSKFFIDHENEIINFVLPGVSFLQYTFTGKFLGRKTPDFSSIKIAEFSFCDFVVHKDKLFCYSKKQSSEDEEELFIYDLKSDVVVDKSNYKGKGYNFFDMENIKSISILKKGLASSMFVNYKDGMFAIFPTAPYMWSHNNTIRINKQYSDTIYQLKGIEMLPYLTVNKGKMQWDVEKAGDKKYGEDKIKIEYWLESTKNIYGVFSIGFDKSAKEYSVLYNKSKNTTHVMSESKILNDISNLMPLQINGVTWNGDFIALYSSDELLAWVEENNASNKEDWIANLKEDDNPVVVLLK